jgi:hypothetical protein
MFVQIVQKVTNLFQEVALMFSYQKQPFFVRTFIKINGTKMVYLTYISTPIVTY